MKNYKWLLEFLGDGPTAAIFLFKKLEKQMKKTRIMYSIFFIIFL